MLVWLHRPQRRMSHLFHDREGVAGGAHGIGASPSSTWEMGIANPDPRRRDTFWQVGEGTARAFAPAKLCAMLLM
jgi:hypothetical protein